MTEFKLPNLGDGVAAGDVLRVLVKVGDTLANDQAVLELETDKATLEVPSSVAGKVTEVKVKQGDKVEPGQVIALMGSSGRSTGPHVHYEVLKAGKQMNPTKFVRASR